MPDALGRQLIDADAGAEVLAEAFARVGGGEEAGGGARSSGVDATLDEIVIHQAEGLQDGAFGFTRLIVAISAQEVIEELADGAAAIWHVNDIRRLHRV